MAKLDGTNGLIQQYDYQTPTTGFTYTFASGTQTLVMNPAGTLATGTVTMPAAPADGMVITVESTQIITALTLSGNTGQSIVGVSATLFANQPLSYVYRLSNTTWYPFSVARSAVLQVVSTALTSATSYSVASGATQAITGLSVSITPSSSTSKIMIFASANISCQNVGGAIYLLRGSTPIGVGDAAGSRTSVSSGSDSATQSLYSETQNPTIQFLDSPATTSSTTYSVSLLNTRGSTDTMYVNRSITDTNASNFGRYISSITVMEIAA